ncbi:MAG: L-threonylcarbamoyladenylate synthase [Candidatus Zixiibacteriota bacterium]
MNNIVEIIATNPGEPEMNLVDRVTSALESGGLVVAPTETQYALMARADSQEAIDRVYRVKRRPASMPTSVFVRSVTAAQTYGKLNRIAAKLAESYLPGPLTLVVPSNGLEQVAPDGRIGLRVSSSAFIMALTTQAGFPITATSACLSGQPQKATAADIATEFVGDVELYIDGGVLDGQASTVVDCCGERPVVLREGVIPSLEIEAMVRGALT